MTVQELKTRNDKAGRLRVFQVADGQYYVESSQGRVAYLVTMSGEDHTCSCGDYSANGKKDPHFTCKHILAVRDGNGNVLKSGFAKCDRPRLDDRFLSDIQGKEFVLYAGLLDLAHQKGLKSVRVEALQYPTEANGLEAICRATIESLDGDIFTEWGDANPKNVNRKIAGHILRMAATRAKARAFRDFTNIGMTCLEELGDFEEVIADDYPQKPRPEKPSRRQARATIPEEPKDEKTRLSVAEPVKPVPKPAPVDTGDEHGDNIPRPSPAQMRAIENLAARRGITPDQLEGMAQQQFGTSVGNLGSSEAASLIRSLQQSA